MSNDVNTFQGTDWFKLELAIEIIGDMIAHYIAELNRAVKSTPRDEDRVSQLLSEIDRFMDERTLCYDKDNNHAVIVKAFMVYAEKFREFRSME